MVNNNLYSRILHNLFTYHCISSIEQLITYNYAQTSREFQKYGIFAKFTDFFFMRCVTVHPLIQIISTTAIVRAFALCC